MNGITTRKNAADLLLSHPLPLASTLYPTQVLFRFLFLIGVDQEGDCFVFGGQHQEVHAEDGVWASGVDGKGRLRGLRELRKLRVEG